MEVLHASWTWSFHTAWVIRVDSFRKHYSQMVEGIDGWFRGDAPRKLA